MAGFPVTIVESGGAPFVAVTRNAPAATVSASGIAITIVDGGAPPLVISGLPAPSWTVLPSIAPTSGNIGTVFTGSDGTIVNGTAISRAWLLNGVVIPGATGSTVTPTGAGTLVYRVTAEGVGGTATASSAAATVVQPVPVNTVVPTVSGTAQVGQVLTSATGTWSNSPTGYTRQWQRNAGAWVNIAGATAATYTPVEADVGATIRVRVIATNAGGSSAPADSAATGPVAPDLVAPVNTALPVITGTALVGETLTIITGTWTGNPTPTYARQWKRAGVNISGATGATYVLVTADMGQAITVTVTATNSQGSASATSAATAPVAQAPVNGLPPSITGNTVVGQTLTSSTGTWQGYPVPTYTRQWRRNGVNIGSATAATYLLVAADAGTTITVTVTATNSQGSASSTSAATATIQQIPSNTALPVITGTAEVGQTLTSTTGTWVGTPTPTYTRQWRADGVNIGGATAVNYIPVVGDVGKVITVVVTATNAAGSASITSAATAAVVDTPVANPFAPFTVTAAAGNDGDTGYYTTIYGGISAEPLAGFPLLEFSTRNANYTQVAFTGDCVATVAGWLPVITGVTLGAVISDWAFDGTYTTGTWDSTGVMAVATEYPITWVQG